MYRDPRSDMPVTQFNMKYVEQAGLVKFDFLGLKTLTVLERAVNLIRRRGIEVDLAHIPLDDEKTYEMLSRGETVGVFQVESAGMRKALIGMRPDRIEDIIALVALYRPGPMENIPTYNARKHGEEEIASIHPKIDHLVEETQGVIVYQEQVMQIAQELSGYSLGEADLLRRAMGKKIRAEMDQQRDRFVDGAVERGVASRRPTSSSTFWPSSPTTASTRAHAAAYAIVSYQTAYLKAHYPVEFLAASMTLDMSNTDKLNDFRQDAMRLGIDVVPPSVHDVVPRFRGRRKPHLLFAGRHQGRRRGGGRAHRRQARATSRSPASTISASGSTRRSSASACFESLIAAGAFDCFGYDRAALLAGLDRMLGLRAARAGERGLAARPTFSGWRGRRPAAEAVDAAGRALASGGKAAPRIPGGRLLPLGASARRIQGRAGQDAGPDLGGVFAPP